MSLSTSSLRQQPEPREKLDEACLRYSTRDLLSEASVRTDNSHRKRAVLQDSSKSSRWRLAGWWTSAPNDDMEDGTGSYGNPSTVAGTYAFVKTAWRSHVGVLSVHPCILGWVLLTFTSLAAIGIVISLRFADGDEESRRANALRVAEDAGLWFSEELNLALLPLFSLAQLVNEINVFLTLSYQIGQAGTSGALPFLPPEAEGDPVTDRNITGVCDNPDLIERFDRIGANIKEEARMGKLLVNLQLAPAAVVCLVYPLNNTEDFPPGVFLDSTAAIGHDLLADPDRHDIALETIRADNVIITGPITLRQCMDCDPSVRQAIIARLAISTQGYQIEIVAKDQLYRTWGFVQALINWEHLVNQSGIYEKIESNGMGFQLTRTDRYIQTETGDYTQKVVILAGSDNLHGDIVSTKIQTIDDEWEISVCLREGFRPPWVGTAVAASVGVALIISLMMMLILIEKHSHRDLLNEMLPPRALRAIRKGETVVERFNTATVFFSDIVGYTAIAAEMTPIDIMQMLNKFYSAMDALADKHKVYKVETIGDAYMVTGGLPDACLGPEGAENVALFALDAIELVQSFRAPDGSQLFIRIGIHSGPVVAGVIGSKRLHYAVFGDTVNAASRMESTSMKMKIQCSDVTCRLLRYAPTHTFHLEDRGYQTIKGKGKMRTWWVNSATQGRPIGRIPLEDETQDETQEVVYRQDDGVSNEASFEGDDEGDLSDSSTGTDSETDGRSSVMDMFIDEIILRGGENERNRRGAHRRSSRRTSLSTI